MKISENYMITEISGETAAIPVGQNVADFSSVLKLNEAARLILDGISAGSSLDKIKLSLYEKYKPVDDAEKAVINSDLDEFITSAKEKGVIVE